MLSVTIRPRKLPETWFDKVYSWLEQQKCEYIVSLELENHLQIGLKSTMRSNNVRRSLSTLLDFCGEDDDEKSKWLKISSHDDWVYLVGYCLKENPKMCKYNLIDDPARYTAYYDIKKAKINEKKKIPASGWECSSINALPLFALNYCREQHLQPQMHKFRSIIIKLFSIGLIPFSLARKIKKDDEDFWEAMVQKLTINEIDRMLEVYRF